MLSNPFTINAIWYIVYEIPAVEVPKYGFAKLWLYLDSKQMVTVKCLFMYLYRPLNYDKWNVYSDKYIQR